MFVWRLIQAPLTCSSPLKSYIVRSLLVSHMLLTSLWECCRGPKIYLCFNITFLFKPRSLDMKCLIYKMYMLIYLSCMFLSSSPFSKSDDCLLNFKSQTILILMTAHLYSPPPILDSYFLSFPSFFFPQRSNSIPALFM